MNKMLIMFYCKHCKRRYKSRSSLRNHISLYHKKKFDRKYKCKTCNKSFTSPTKYLKHRKSEHPSLLLIDHQPDVNHDLPSSPNLPPLPESDSDEPISPTKRKANGFDEGDNEPSDKIPKPVKRKANGIDGNDKKRFKFNDSEIVDDSEDSSDEPIVLPPKKDDKYKNLYHELEGRLIALQHEKDYLVDQYNECQREVLRLQDEIEDLLEKNRLLSDKVADINSNMISNHAFKCTSIEEFAYLRNLFREGDYSKINDHKVIKIIQRLLMALNAGYNPICNKQQTQVTEGQRKMIKKLEGASIGEAKRIIQNQFNDISSVFNVMDRSIKFIVDTYKDY